MLMREAFKLVSTGNERKVNSPLDPTHHVYVGGKHVGIVTKTHYGYDYHHGIKKRTLGGKDPSERIGRDMKEVRANIKKRFT